MAIICCLLSIIEFMLEKFLHPKSIAIIGASNNKEKLGFQILNNLKNGGYRGNIFPVNLKDEKVAGLKAFGDITDLAGKVDLALIVIPAKFVLAEVKKCAVSGIKNIIIVSAGFSETGKEGALIESEIQRIGQKNNLNILGPNCLGIINTEAKLNTTFARIASGGKIRQGNVAFISQSGAVGSAVLDWLADKNFGLSYFVSLGNKAVLDENAFFDFFKNDKNTDFIIAYLEEIENGREFMKIVSRLSKIKPVAILKTGKSKAGKEAVMSHTGSLAGSNEAFETAFRRTGVIEIESMQEAFSLVRLAQRPADFKNQDMFIISNAGGPLVMTIDQFAKFNFSIGKYQDKTVSKLKKQIPELHAPQNPLDIIGDAPAVRYEKALSIALSDENLNNLLVLLTPQTSTEIDETAKIISKLSKKYSKKLICASFLGGASIQSARRILDEGGVPNFDYPEQAVKAMAKLIKNRFQAVSLPAYNYASPEGIVKTPYQFFGEKKGEQLDYLESFKFLNKYKISNTKTIRIDSVSDLEKINYPIVLKVVGKDLIHKTDENSIRLNLKNTAEAQKAFSSFNGLLKNENNYCVAQSMGGGLEMILGFRRDKSFGPIIMVGLGGIYAEILEDIQLEIDDLDYDRAMEMIKGLKAYKILRGARGQKAYDVNALADTLVNLARLARENHDIKELDINPLFITDKGVKAVDVRIIL